MGRRLIDADSLIELIDDDIASLGENMSREGYDVCLCTLKMAKQYIKALPTVEAEPRVRCKDCKYHEDEELGMVWCPFFIGSWVENDFHCAVGERKDEVEE